MDDYRRTVDDETTEIHVLRHGAALCPLPGVPREWPEGHKWVTVLQHQLATCAPCRVRAKEVLAATPSG